MSVRRDRTTTRQDDTRATKQDCTWKQSADGAHCRCYARQREYEIRAGKRSCSRRRVAGKRLFKNSPRTRSVAVSVEVSFPFERDSPFSLYLSFPFSPFLCPSIYLSVYEPPRSRVAAVFAVDTALQLRPRVASFASFLLVSCVLSPPRVHSRLLRGTRLSLTSNPKATHRRVPRETLSAPTRYILIGHVGFIDRSPSTSAQQARRRLMADRYARV